MKTVTVKISESDFKKYNFNKPDIKFSDLEDIINIEYAKKALLECNRIADEVGLSKMSLSEINAEIKAVRDAKNNS